MTPIFIPDIPAARDVYERTLWEREQAFRYYAAQRRANCTYLQLMDLWLEAPYCDWCMQSAYWYTGQLPDVLPETWQENLESLMGAEYVREVAPPDGIGHITCHRRGCTIEPWDGDSLHVVRYHLEEHYSIPLDTPGRTWPSLAIRSQIMALYDNACFGCGATGGLHIDHILPRALGGDAAFRNLQPLCTRCGNLKGASAPEDVGVSDPMCFWQPPSDAYEGLFW